MGAQKGFGVTRVMIVLLVLGLLAGSGWFVYSKNYRSTPAPAAPIPKQVATEYKFSPVIIDSSKWKALEPFQGFTIKYPLEWKINNEEKFGKQITDGRINNPNPTYITFKSTYLFSPDLTTKKQGDYQPDNKSGDVAKGGRIRIVMIQKNEANTGFAGLETPCSGKNSVSELLNFNGFKACEQKYSDSHYNIQTSTKNMDYSVELSFDKRSSNEKKNYYRSLHRELVKNFQLY